MDIRTQKQVRRHAVRQSVLASSPQPRTQKSPKKRRKLSRKSLVRYGIIIANLCIVGFFIFMVLKYSNTNAATYGARSSDQSPATNPLDQLSAADIAVSIARMTNMAEVNAVTNYADTINAELLTFGDSAGFARIPQIMTSNLKTLADVIEYEVQPGDTVPLLAERFAVTSDSIKWSNDLVNDALQPGLRILIPPMNGILYTLRDGDTPEKLSQLYKVSIESITAFNDTELTGFLPGKRIFLPNAQKPTPVFNFFVRYGNNGYDPGWCTYYAAAKGGAPGGWGHARTWAVGAARTPGWIVSKIPVKGAIAQTTAYHYFGHVAIVEDVKQEDGIYYIRYSDMNGIAGFNAVGYSGWVKSDHYQNYIYRVQ